MFTDGDDRMEQIGNPKKSLDKKFNTQKNPIPKFGALKISRKQFYTLYFICLYSETSIKPTPGGIFPSVRLTEVCKSCKNFFNGYSVLW